MKVFQSLNCVLCEKPFARKANEPRSPRSLGCGVVMCNECIEKEMPLKIEERQHQCNYEDCFTNCVFAFYLLDVLSQEDAVVLSSTGDGYVLVKPFKVPECPICHDEYSNQSKEKKSFALYCNHLICTECYLKNRKLNDGNKKYEYQHGFTCPICSRNSCFSGDEWKGQFHDFLDELPELTRQMKGVENSRVFDECKGTDIIEKMFHCVEYNSKVSPELTRQMKGVENSRVCDECKGTDIIEKMFHCVECNSKVCAFCFMEKHENTSHEKIKLMEKEANERSDALQKESTGLVKTYDEMFTELHKGALKIINDVGKKLVLKENLCEDTQKFEDLEQKFEEYRKIQKGFETASDEYMLHLRRYITKLEKFIEEPDKENQGEPDKEDLN